MAQKQLEDAKFEEESEDDHEEHQQRRKYAMWLPNLVPDREQRFVANCVWITSLLVFLAFSLFTIIKPYQQRNDPPANEKTQDGLFQIPDVVICFDEDGYGCRAHGLPKYPQYRNTTGGEFCASSAKGIAFGFENMQPNITAAERDIFPFQLVDSKPECVAFPTSTLKALDNGMPIGFRVELMWHTRSDLDQSIDAEFGKLAAVGTEHSHHGAEVVNMVPVYLVRPGSDSLNELDNDEKTYYTPFNIVNFSAPDSYRNQHWADDGHETIRGQFSSTVLQLHLFEHLNAPEQYEYMADATAGQVQLNVSALFETVHAQAEQEEFMNDYFAWTILEIYILTLKSSITKEIDPVNWTVIIGVIGGTWGYVLLAFSIFYRPASPDDDFVLRKQFRHGLEASKKVPIVRKSLHRASSRRRSSKRKNLDGSSGGGGAAGGGSGGMSSSGGGEGLGKGAAAAVGWVELGQQKQQQHQREQQQGDEEGQDDDDNKYNYKGGVEPSGAYRAYTVPVAATEYSRSFSSVVHDVEQNRQPAASPSCPPKEEGDEEVITPFSPLHKRLGHGEDDDRLSAVI